MVNIQLGTFDRLHGPKGGFHFCFVMSFSDVSEKLINKMIIPRKTQWSSSN
jgi:hypothetical protein